MNAWTCFGALSGKNSKRITPKSVVITASRLAASSDETGGGSAPGIGAFFLRGGWAKPTELANRNRERKTRRQGDKGTRGQDIFLPVSPSPCLLVPLSPCPLVPVAPSPCRSVIILSPRFRWRESKRATC